MFSSAKFDKMLLVVTLESAESSQCVIGLLHKNFGKGASKKTLIYLRRYYEIKLEKN